MHNAKELTVARLLTHAQRILWRKAENLAWRETHGDVWADRAALDKYSRQKFDLRLTAIFDEIQKRRVVRSRLTGDAR